MGRLVGVGSVYDSGTVELSCAEVGICGSLRSRKNA